MPTSRQVYAAAFAAGLAIAFLPHPADARGGGGHGSGRGGMATSPALTSHTLPAIATAPGGKTGLQSLSQPQTVAPAPPGIEHRDPAGRLESATSQKLTPPSTVPGTGQTGGQPPSQAQTGAAAADASISAAAIAGVQSTTIPATPLPASALAAPAPQAAAVAPLSPAPAAIIESSGGPARTDTVASPAVSSTSPSESAPSTAGGGGDTLQACMAFWDRGTHMTTVEWRAACTRTLNRIDLTTPGFGEPRPAHPGSTVIAHHRATR